MNYLLTLQSSMKLLYKGESSGGEKTGKGQLLCFPTGMGLRIRTKGESESVKRKPHINYSLETE